MDKDLENWNRFVKDGLLLNQDSNVKYEFNKMSKKFGKAYIDYLKAAWKAWTKECGTREDFCRINGNVPIEFLDKL